MFALEMLLEKLRRLPNEDITIASSSAGYLTDIDFNRREVFKYCKLHFISVTESIDDLINYLKNETTQD